MSWICRNPKAIIFDLDGTLLDILADIGAGWGFRGPKELEENGCRTLMQDPLEILPLASAH